MASQASWVEANSIDNRASIPGVLGVQSDGRSWPVPAGCVLLSKFLARQAHDVPSFFGHRGRPSKAQNTERRNASTRVV